MSDDADLDELLSGIGSGADDQSDEAGGGDDDADADTVSSEDSYEDQVPAEEETMTSDDEGEPITQAEVYENLKRIGELEDEKQKIQDELRERTEQLRAVLKHIDRNSILYKMLQSALPAPPPRASSANVTKKAAPKPATKKAPKKKPRRKK